MSRLTLFRFSWLGPAAAVPLALGYLLALNSTAALDTFWLNAAGTTIMGCAMMVLSWFFPQGPTTDALSNDRTIIHARLRIEMLETMIADVTAARRTLIDRAVDDILSGLPNTDKIKSYDDTRS